MRDNLYFKLASNCVIVNGKLESIVCDLKSGKYIPVPNIIYNVLEENENSDVDIKGLKKHFENKCDEGIDSFLSFLKNEKLGVLTKEKLLLRTRKTTSWDYPRTISNAIIEVSDLHNYDVHSAIKQLNDLQCEAIEIRFLESVYLDKVMQLLQSFLQSFIKCYILYLKFDNSLNNENVIKLHNAVKQVNRIVIHSTPLDFIKKPGSNIENKVIYTRRKILKNTPESVSSENLVLNVSSFNEAQKFNLGLNRKVCIDSYGNIKNHLLHQTDYGNLNNTTIENVVKDNRFQEKWEITHDKIEICRDCQYRYMCADNSDIIQERGKYKKVGKCNFDPYTNKWRN